MPARTHVRFTHGDVPEGFVKLDSDDALIESAKAAFEKLIDSADGLPVELQDLIAHELKFGPDEGDILVGRPIPFSGVGPTTCAFLNKV